MEDCHAVSFPFPLQVIFYTDAVFYRHRPGRRLDCASAPHSFAGCPLFRHAAFSSRTTACQSALRSTTQPAGEGAGPGPRTPN